MAPRIDYDSDPNFVIVEDVPILDEHSLFIPGNPEKKTEDRTVHVNAEMLAEIAANNNRNVAETGDMVPLIEGHTRDDVPESEQPEILGWADSFRVGPLFNTGRACILSRWKVPKDPTKLEKVRKLPRRSVELWLDRKEINPIALLGATAPERNLGLLRLARMSMRAREENGKLLFSAARELIRFQYDPQTMQAQMPCPGMPATQPADPRTAAYTPTQGTQTPQVDPALIQAVVAALQQTDVWQFMQQQLQQSQMVGGMGGGLGGLGGGMDPLMALLGGGMGGGEPGMGEPAPGDGEEQRKDDEKVNMQAGMPGQGMGTPGGGTNGFLPGMVETTSDRTTYPPRNSMNARDYMRAGESAEQAIVRLARERDEAVKLSRENRVLVELTALVQQEGIPLDAQEELPRLVAMDDNARNAEYARLRAMHARYQRMGTVARPGTAATLPTLNMPATPGQSTEDVPTPAPGQQTPDRRYQRSPQQMEAPMTAEEKEACVNLALELQRRNGGTPPDMREVLRLYRSGQVVRNGAAERVY